MHDTALPTRARAPATLSRVGSLLPARTRPRGADQRVAPNTLAFRQERAFTCEVVICGSIIPVDVSS